MGKPDLKSFLSKSQIRNPQQGYGKGRTMQTGSLSLSAVLIEHKSVLVARWLQQMLQTYPEPSLNFLTQQQDPFRNPIGHTLKEGLSMLFDGILQPGAVSAMQPALDNIIRIRAVQDISASRAISFVFLLKQIIRAEFPKDAARFADDLAALEARIDETTLLAFDLFMKCREQIFELKANEGRRMAFVAERIQLKETAGPVNKTR
jgi:hypothetical protein